MTDGHIIIGDGSGAPTTLAAFTSSTGVLKVANGGTGTAYFTVAGPSTTRTYTFPDAAATIARTDAGQTFTGVQIFTSPTVNTAITAGDATVALLNTTATTVNAFGAATTLNIGAAATCILNFGGSTTASEFRFLEPSGSGTNYSAFKAVAQAASITYSLPPAVGAAGTFLKDAAGDGVLTWAALPASGISFVGGPSTDFQAAARYGAASAGSATADFTGTTGVTLACVATAGYYALKWLSISTSNPFGISNVFSTNTTATASSAEGQIWSWVGAPTVTTNTLSLITTHFGFRGEVIASTESAGASNANATTETYTEFQANFSLAAFYPILHAYQNGTTNIKYYGGATLLATHTTNLPTVASNNWMSCGVTNDNTADTIGQTFPFMSLNFIV